MQWRSHGLRRKCKILPHVIKLLRQMSGMQGNRSLGLVPQLTANRSAGHVDGRALLVDSDRPK